MDHQELLRLGADDVAALLASPDAFAWSPCTYALTTPEGSWPVSSSLEPVPPLSVSMERLPIAMSSGWAWHKNHQLPRLNVACSSAPPEGAILLSAVTVDVLTHAAHDAGLEGGTLQPLVNGACSFSSLTFKTTSYNLKGKPIHLMASLLVREGERLCVGASLLSPPLLVDARKRQSKEEKSIKAESGSSGPAQPRAQGQAGGLLPFAPALLERKLEKVDRESARHEIDNSLDGLRAYLSALNIRNKCKHPLFLVLRFNACVGLWYDATSGADPLADDASFCAMMRSLAALDGTKTPPNAAPTGDPPRQPPFVVAIKTLHDSHACQHLGCPVRLPSSLSLPHASTLPSTYRELCDHQLSTLRRTYCRLYCSHGTGVAPHTGLAADSAQTSHLVPCDSCGTLAPGAHHASSSALVSEEQAKAQQQAGEVLAFARQKVVGGEEAGDDDAHDCPLSEWEAGLRVLAEALALHCNTRSPDEVIAFMQHEEARANKRSSQDSSHTTYVQAQPIGQPPQALLALPAPPPPAPAAEAEVHCHGDHMLA
eukprot:Transcript_2032.p1 GENE.Transcript_2032~~Transcript_2032.p1  ORF type:complete len:541 (-),score=180.83 Transcript_2032:212-1834(-)